MYQCYGGVLGLVALLEVAPKLMLQAPSAARLSGLVLWAVVAALMSALALSGGLLLRGHRLGVGASVGVQLAQIFYFSLGPASYLFFGGFYLGIALEQNTLTATAGWQVYAELGEATGRAFLGINLIPLAIIGMLTRSPSSPNGSGRSQPFGYSLRRTQSSTPRSARSSE